MSELKVEVVKIGRIETHPNADRLELVYIADWQVVVQKGKLYQDQAVIYFPIDSILPAELECYLFPIDSKIKLEKSRIRTIKIRGAISQGMIVSLEELRSAGFINRTCRPGDDVAEELKITKFEPPEKHTPQDQAGKKVSKKKKNPHFFEYSDLQNFKWYPHLFQEGEEVVVLEKVHGTNFRCGYVPFHASTIWKKVKKFFGLTPKYEFVYGSHRVQLQDKLAYTGFYDKNVYAEAVVKYDLPNKLKEGEVIYGEVYGDPIQKDYHYGLIDERKLVIFDIKRDNQYMSHGEVVDFCRERDLPHAPIDYVGPYQSKEHLLEFVDSPSKLHPDTKVREGVVIKSLVEQQCYMGRKALKFKSDIFLLKAEDDNH